nr:hypothetical protein CFP56_63548 [Quercus suber]
MSYACRYLDVRTLNACASLLDQRRYHPWFQLSARLRSIASHSDCAESHRKRDRSLRHNLLGSAWQTQSPWSTSAGRTIFVTRQRKPELPNIFSGLLMKKVTQEVRRALHLSDRRKGFDDGLRNQRNGKGSGQQPRWRRIRAAQACV